MPSKPRWVSATWRTQRPSSRVNKNDTMCVERSLRGTTTIPTGVDLGGSLPPLPVAVVSPIAYAKYLRSTYQ